MLAILVLAATQGSAQWCTPTTSRPEVDAFGFYVDIDCLSDGCFFSIWIYQETNLVEGLQRGDEVHDDTCGGMVRSDRIVF